MQKWANMYTKLKNFRISLLVKTIVLPSVGFVILIMMMATTRDENCDADGGCGDVADGFQL
jgi:hypothetical protein